MQEYDDDFDNFSPEKDGEEGEEEEVDEGDGALALIGPDELKCLNDYMKGTSYARKNKPNLEAFNNVEQYLYLFEEFTMVDKFYIYSDASIAKAIYHFSRELGD